MRAILNTGNARCIAVGLFLAMLIPGGCPDGLSGILVGSSTSTTGNPFATLTEQGLVEANIETQSSEVTTGAAAGEDADLSFRDDLTVTFVNTASDRELSTNFIAWVEPGNVRTESQRDSLISSGYIEIASRLTIGVAYDLSEGTFVYQGSGGSGLERISLGPTGAGQTLIPSTLTLTLVTPDVMLVYLDPPVSCTSTAFRFLDEGDVIAERFGGGGGTDGTVIFGSATNIGPNKTLSQIDAYQCDPFLPGLFFRQGGGVQEVNEFVEGDDVTFTFYRFPLDEDGNQSANGNAAEVTYAGTSANTTETSTDGDDSES